MSWLYGISGNKPSASPPGNPETGEDIEKKDYENLKVKYGKLNNLVDNILLLINNYKKEITQQRGGKKKAKSKPKSKPKAKSNKK